MGYTSWFSSRKKCNAQLCTIIRRKNDMVYRNKFFQNVYFSWVHQIMDCEVQLDWHVFIATLTIPNQDSYFTFSSRKHRLAYATLARSMSGDAHSFLIDLYISRTYFSYSYNRLSILHQVHMTASSDHLCFVDVLFMTRNRDQWVCSLDFSSIGHWYCILGYLFTFPMPHKQIGQHQCSPVQHHRSNTRRYSADTAQRYSGSKKCPNVCMFFTKVDNP